MQTRFLTNLSFDCSEKDYTVGDKFLMVMDKPRSVSSLTYLLLMLGLSCYNIAESKCPNMCDIGKMLQEIKNELAEMKEDIKCLKENKSIGM